MARNRAAAVAILVTGDDDLREAVIDAQECGMQIVIATIDHTGQPNAAPTLLREADDHIVLDHAFLAPFFSHRVPLAMRRATGPIAVVAPPAALAATATTAAAVPATLTPIANAVPPPAATAVPTPVVNAVTAVTGPPAAARPVMAAQPSVATPALQQVAATAAEAFAVDWMSKATANEVQGLVAGAPKIPRTLDMDLLRAVERQLGRAVGPDQSLRQSARLAFWAAVRKNRPVS